MQLCNFHNLRFQELFTQYTAEPRDSENRRRYEQEIREMERQRGYDVRLILTKPWHVLRTIVNGRHKAYVNMCSSRALKKPYRPTAADRARQMYRQWSLHYVTNPARQELDRDRCRVLIYDVAFHPDTLHRASRSLSFRSHVDLTALHSVAQQYHVHVDTRNVQIMRCKYMGRRQPTFYRTLLPLPLPKPQGVTGSLQKSKTTLPPGEAGDSRASPLETTLPPGEASDSRASPLETTLPPGEASDSRASPLETTLPPGEASDSRASPLETTLSPEEASDSRASPLETTLPPGEASDSRASALETTLPPGEASDSRASALETTLSPEEASDSRASPLETTVPHYTIRHRSFFSLQDYRNPRDSAPSPVPQELVITVYLPLLKEESAIVLQIHPKDLSLESYNPAYKLQLDLPYLVEDGRHMYDYDTTKKQLFITLPVVQQDLPSLMPTPPPAKEGSPKPNRTTRDAEKTPPNSIFTCSQDATTVTLFIHMKDIDQHSVTSEVSSHQCEVRFCVKTSNAPCVLFVAFQPQYSLNTDEIDVNVSANNMVLKLTKSTANFRPWKSLYFGVNSNTLQERSFSNEKNMAANRLPPSTMPWSTQINVLEMTDRRTHIRLKIYVEEEHLLTEEEQHWGLSGLLSLRSSHSDSTSQSDTSETSEESRQSPHLPMGCPTSPPAQPSAQRTHTDHPAEEDEGLCTPAPELDEDDLPDGAELLQILHPTFHTDRVLYDVACSDSSALFFSDHRTLCAFV
ncbi:LOW QUALITY PROTEIN: protein kintoun-like [Anomaloglossus baeobatrachus]|uniref:LOW QUALITY PROTEIN: protein kintoun-like n=1 Tax=Anomaloglossus baeobatrachus TaxID=238106 RepID=UPI003F4F706C